MNTETQQAAPRVVIVGAGHGGSAVAAALRQFGFAGAITLVGDEPAIPYQRPPLSKGWLKGEVTLEGLALKPAAFYDKQGIELRLGVRVEGLDTATRKLRLAGGETLPYDHLVLATGAEPRRLPQSGTLANVLTLRSLADGEALRQNLGPGRRLVVIGGGYIGLECAAAARSQGTEVVVLEKLPRLLERVASREVATFLQSYHERHGVRFCCSASVAALRGDGGADEVVLEDGRSFPCDAVLVGIGVVPSMAIAQQAGIGCDNGIRVDADGRTSAPDVFAVGDVASRPHPLYQRELRLESIPSANEQAKRVASVIAGREPAPPDVPAFWSDQYDLKLQIAGLAFDVDTTVLRGDPAAAKFAVFQLSKGRVVTVESINSAPDFVAGKKLIAAGTVVDAAALADTAVPLATLAG